MTELEIKLQSLESMLAEDGYNDSNIVYQTVKEMQQLAIINSRCCETLNENLPTNEDFENFIGKHEEMKKKYS